MDILYQNDSADLDSIKEKIFSFVQENGWNATLVISLPNVPTKDLRGVLKKELGTWASVEFLDQTVFVLDFENGKDKVVETWEQGEDPETASGDTTVYIYPREFHKRGPEATERLREFTEALQTL